MQGINPNKDYYGVLGIGSDATYSDIKKAYRKAAMQYHPDKNSGSNEFSELFSDAREAESVLSDPFKRRVYDTQRNFIYDPEVETGMNLDGNHDKRWKEYKEAEKRAEREDGIRRNIGKYSSALGTIIGGLSGGISGSNSDQISVGYGAFVGAFFGGAGLGALGRLAYDAYREIIKHGDNKKRTKARSIRTM